MKETRVKLDEILEELYYLREENQALSLDNDFLQRQNKALKNDNARITIERNKLCDKLHEIQSLTMYEFANRYCTSESLEDAGRAFAKELLGGK